MAIKKSYEETPPIADINITPLVDVCLVLVIIFMVTANFTMQGGINLTQSALGAASGKQSTEENVKIILTKDDKILLNGRLISKDNLESELRAGIAKSRDKLVTIVADKANRVESVVDVMDLAKQAGALKLSVLKKLQE
ncbi:MAG: biopolymer transporter ExbD [Candidatus Firestonebacteria bacterium]|nr:biopolymer transporter ExbD [Candidatus Firestonebacteria bacterium]